MLCQVEHAPERTRRNALVQIFAGGLLGLPALDGERVLLGCDVDVVGAKACDRQRDPVVIFAGTLDVVGRVVVLARVAQRAVDEDGLREWRSADVWSNRTRRFPGNRRV